MATTDRPWEPLAKAFMEQYYKTFDSDRSQCVALYHPEAWMQFEQHRGQGHDEIRKILTEKVTFQSIQHVVTTMDSQPTSENGVIIVIMGRLKTDDDPIHGFSQTFYLRQFDNNFFLTHDIFRLSIHDSA